jgi:hypothetical protein
MQQLVAEQRYSILKGANEVRPVHAYRSHNAYECVGSALVTHFTTTLDDEETATLAWLASDAIDGYRFPL